jgi:choline-sulfatase
MAGQSHDQSHDQPVEQPNVLCIVTDQQQARALGAVDDSYDTPALDALAGSGTLFANAYCTHPQCSPSRSSLVSGQFPHQTGVYTLPYWGGYPMPEDATSVGRAFREAGYDAVWTGKWHLGSDNVAGLGWEEADPAPDERDDDEVDSRVGMDAVTADRAEAYLEGADEPFFLTASFRLPHPPYLVAEEVADRYDRASVPIPDSYYHDDADKPDYHRERRAHWDLSEEDVRQMGYEYRTMVSQVDAYVGQLLDALEREGLREETVVLFTSDHGDLTGAHGIGKKGALPYEELLRVPLIVDVPWIEGPDCVSDLVSLAAVPGTMLDAAGLGVDDFEGGSLVPHLRGEPGGAGGNRVFFEHKYAHWGEFPFRGVREGDWKYVEYLDRDDEELYHLGEDPSELHNRAGDPAFDEVTARLRGAVENWWDRTGGDVDDWVESPVPED